MSAVRFPDLRMQFRGNMPFLPTFHNERELDQNFTSLYVHIAIRSSVRIVLCCFEKFHLNTSFSLDMIYF